MRDAPGLEPARPLLQARSCAQLVVRLSLSGLPAPPRRPRRLSGAHRTGQARPAPDITRCSHRPALQHPTPASYYIVYAICVGDAYQWHKKYSNPYHMVAQSRHIVTSEAVRFTGLSSGISGQNAGAHRPCICRCLTSRSVQSAVARPLRCHLRTPLIPAQTH